MLWARFKRWLWLLNKLRQYEPWQALNIYDYKGCACIAAVLKVRDEELVKVFWTRL